MYRPCTCMHRRQQRASTSRGTHRSAEGVDDPEMHLVEAILAARVEEVRSRGMQVTHPGGGSRSPSATMHQEGTCHFSEVSRMTSGV